MIRICDTGRLIYTDKYGHILYEGEISSSDFTIDPREIVAKKNELFLMLSQNKDADSSMLLEIVKGGCTDG